jgi:recombination associated protein RdgC
MWFKNLIVYRLPDDWRWTAPDLEEALARRPLQPCGPLEARRHGWVEAAGSGRLLHTVHQQHLIALGTDEKLLPASVIRQETAERARAQAETQGFPVGRRQMREIKLRVTEELRARALTRRRTTRAWIDPPGGWLVVDSAGVARAEELVETLRDTLGSLAVRFVDTRRTPSSAMGTWLGQGDAPGRFAIDQDLELQTAGGEKATVRYRRHPLDGEEIRRHLAAGKHPTQLGLTWSGRVSFVLTEKLQIKRVEFLEMTREQGGAEEVDPAEQLDIDFVVMTGELGKLLGELVLALGGESTERTESAAEAA